ncbi:MAG: hybrid sensor histidine kinase/response regulator [Chthoniobacteraceae bacterium]
MKTILVVDDRTESRAFLKKLLGYARYSVVEASDGQGGLAKVRETKPDLVIADLLMPRMDGYEFVRLLRADPAIAQTRVIFYSANYLEEEAQELARACGVEHVLRKPSDPERILEVVAKALGQGVPLPARPVRESFSGQHLRVVTDKLAAKVAELEALNIGLEERVALRTAELAAANDAQRSASRLKDEFLAIVSHDLRSPLAGIALVVEQLIQRGDAVPVTRRSELLGMVGKTVSRQVELVNDLLELAANASGRIRLELAEFLLSALARECVRAVEVAACAKDLTVETAAETGEPPVIADRLKLTRVINNLLTNAIKFTPAGGRITVSVKREHGGVCLQVADNGMGIEAARLPQLFEKFKMDHKLGTEGEAGSGLGLGIVLQLAELHGGRVSVASQPGRGSTFSIHLPLPGADTPAVA